MTDQDSIYLLWRCAGKTKAGNDCKKPAHYRDYGANQDFCWQHAPQYAKDFKSLNLAEVIAFHLLGPTSNMRKDMLRLKRHMRRLNHADK